MRLHAKADKQIISIRNEARYRGRSPPVTSSQRDGASKRINRPIPRPAYAPAIKRENTRKSARRCPISIQYLRWLFILSFLSFFLFTRISKSISFPLDEEEIAQFRGCVLATAGCAGGSSAARRQVAKRKGERFSTLPS